MNEKWIKYVAHNLSINTDLSTIKTELEKTYPALTLAQAPRWLTTTRRENQISTALVLTFAGPISIKALGTKHLTINGERCRLTPYYEYSAATRCTNCQLYGHPSKLCAETQPTCAVCSSNHATSTHPCKIPGCRQGPTCTHPPFFCRACQAPHKSSDALCPSRAKAELTATERNISGVNGERHHVGDTDTPDNSGCTPPPADQANNDVVMGEGRQSTIATDNTDESQIVI
jgi:hypothetical protein